MTTQMTRDELIARFTETEVPTFDRKYTKVQGPASTMKSTAGRTFSASGPKADLIAKIIFADLGLTRQMIADLVHCSPSRVSEVVWALENAVDKGQIESFPPVPRTVGGEATPSTDAPPTEELIDNIEKSIEAAKASKATKAVKKA